MRPHTYLNRHSRTRTKKNQTIKKIESRWEAGNKKSSHLSCFIHGALNAVPIRMPSSDQKKAVVACQRSSPVEAPLDFPQECEDLPEMNEKQRQAKRTHSKCNLADPKKINVHLAVSSVRHVRSEKLLLKFSQNAQQMLCTCSEEALHLIWVGPDFALKLHLICTQKSPKLNLLIAIAFSNSSQATRI